MHNSDPTSIKTADRSETEDRGIMQPSNPNQYLGENAVFIFSFLIFFVIRWGCYLKNVKIR